MFHTIRTHTGGSIQSLIEGHYRGPHTDTGSIRDASAHSHSRSQIHRIIGTGSAIKGSRFAIFEAQAQLRVENAHYVDGRKSMGIYIYIYTLYNHYVYTNKKKQATAFCYCLADLLGARELEQTHQRLQLNLCPASIALRSPITGTRKKKQNRTQTKIELK